MRQWQARLFIAIDEWLGFYWAVYLFEHHRDTLFWPFVVAWVVFVYGLSYPPYWHQYGAWPFAWRKR